MQDRSMVHSRENTDRFLDAYNRIEKFLQKCTHEGKGTRFFDLIETAAKSNRIVRNKKDDLKEIGDLRNAIVHERGGRGVPIAVPNEMAVTLIEKLANLLTTPPGVIPAFAREVFVCCHNDPVAVAVKAMYKFRFSQIPILKNGYFFSLLTANTLACWLGSCAVDEIFSIEETSIEEVCAFAEYEDNYRVISEDTSVFEVVERFQEYEYKGKRLDALLITKSGKETEKFLGIITVWDLPEVYEMVK